MEKVETLEKVVVGLGLGYGLCSMFKKPVGSLLASGMRKVSVSAMESQRESVYREAGKFPAMNAAILEEIIKRNQGTTIGRDKGLLGMTVEEFRATVPLSTFKDYIEYIERMKKGEADVLHPGVAEAFATSSGTTGTSKYIPLQNEMMQSFRNMFNFSFAGPLALMPGAREAIKAHRSPHFSVAVSSSRMRKTAGGAPAGPLSTFSMENWIPGPLLPLMDAIMYAVSTQPHVLLAEVEDYEAMLYLNLLFAVASRDIPYIMLGIAPTTLHVLQMMEQNRDHLVRDVRSGTLTCPWVTVGLSQELIDAFTNTLRYYHSAEEREVRAKELEDEFACGFIKIAPRIWPELRFVSTAIGGPFAVYRKELEHYLGNTPICCSLYAASEGAIGMARDLSSTEYILNPDDCYFEFLDASVAHDGDDAHKNLLRSDELVIGQDYELVLTNKRGFLRYRLGDVVRVTDMLEGVWPVVEVCYRMGSLLDIFGEKTSEEQMATAIDTALAAVECRSVNFTSRTLLNSSPAAYCVYLEINGDLPPDFDISFALDSSLQDTNEVYRDCRTAGKLGLIHAKLVPAGTFDVFFKFLVEAGAAVGQVKVPHLIHKQEHIDLFESFFE